MTDRLTRRSLLGAGAALAGATALGACDSGGTSAGAPQGAPSASGTASPYVGDLKVVAFATALENLAANTYDLVLSRAGAGRLGLIPPAVSGYLTTTRGHHAAHAGAWNQILTDSGLAAVGGAPLSIGPMMAAAVENASGLTDALKVLAALEQSIAATHLSTAGGVSDARAVVVAATVAPVEAEHAAVLDFLLGSYPVPADMLSTSPAVSPATLRV